MISIVGIGSSREDMSMRALNAIKNADVIITYKGYVKLIEDLIEGKEIIVKGMGDEIERAEIAIKKSREGYQVAVISSGDPGVFGMGNVIFQILGKYKNVDLEIIPGITAVNYVASLLGAPLHDYAVISLSDVLTPLSEIKRKVEYASKGDFVIALYNPQSKTRREPFKEAYKILLDTKRASTPVGIVKSKDDGIDVIVTTLSELINEDIDMSTTVIIGNSMTYICDGYMVTPRGYIIPYYIHPLAREFYTEYLAGGGPEGSNKECEYYPCHFEGQNCSLCYCPFYPCGEGSTGGKWIKDKGVWSCEDCSWIHEPKTVECIQAKLHDILQEVNDLKDKKKELLKLRRECIQKTSGEGYL